MSKKSGVAKWLSRLIGYGYINPDDDDKGGYPPQSVTDDGGRGKPFDADAAKSSSLEQGKEPRDRNANRDA